MTLQAVDDLIPETLWEWQEHVYEWAIAKGWEPDRTRTFGDECMLIVTEVAEAIEAYRVRGLEDHTDESGKPDDVASEFADILIRLMHYASVHAIDLQTEMKRKMKYNEGRSYRHGGKRL
jgi:NTP pyrophosphatase (non-canonical NTP hydrolase)